jgi:hypothetical protein
VPYEPERLPETPAQLPGPIAWEEPSLSFPRRLFGTLKSSFAPLTSIQAVASGSVGSALRFCLLWTLPWMAAWAIMPFTYTLNFKHLTVEPLAGQSTLPVAWDVARAAGIGVLLSSIALLSWGVPFASLFAAFAKMRDPSVNAHQAAWRMVLYRSWIVPCGLSLLVWFGWTLPPEPNPWLVEIPFLILYVMPGVLIWMHCFAMARYFGVEGLASLAVASVPMGVEFAIGLWVGKAAAVWAPHVPGAQ